MTVGIVGGGQLARMMALAGYPLGLDFLVLDRDDRTPAAQVAPALSGAFTDPALLDELARRSEQLLAGPLLLPGAAGLDVVP